MKDFLKVVGYVLIGVLMVGAMTFGLNAVGLASFSFWAPKYEAARREVVQQSLRRQEGVNEGLASLCLNMRLASDDQSARAFANMIVIQGGATGTELTPDSEACVREAEGRLGLQ